MAAPVSESVSIIIATRNRSGILALALAALPAGVKGLEPPEVVVVDDCSSDATRQIVEDFSSSSGWRVVYRNQLSPMGANAARNEGLRMAGGQTIVFIDDDVIVTEGWLSKLLSGLSNENVVATGPMHLTVRGPIFGKHREEVSGYFSEVLTASPGLEGEIVPVLGNMAASRHVFESAKFREAIRPPVEEIDWMRRSGVRTQFVPEAIVWHYKTQDEIQLKRLLKMAWARGSEGGWWIRECVNGNSNKRWLLAGRSLSTSLRGFGHAVVQRCWGGVVVGIGELSKAFSLAGLINRGSRMPESWR